MERHVAVMMDVKGPEIRTGPVSTPLLLKVGSLLEFHTESSSAFGSRRSNQRQLGERFGELSRLRQ